MTPIRDRGNNYNDTTVGLKIGRGGRWLGRWQWQQQQLVRCLYQRWIVAWGWQTTGPFAGDLGIVARQGKDDGRPCCWRLIQGRWSPGGQSLINGGGRRPQLQWWEGNCQCNNNNNNDDDRWMNITNGLGDGGNRTLSLGKEAEDHGAKPWVAQQEFGRLCRGGGPPAALQ